MTIPQVLNDKTRTPWTSSAAVRYGTGTAKGAWFLHAQVALPSGEVIKSRHRSRKSSAGFDTTKLSISAEWTLRIVADIPPFSLCHSEAK
ncbi:hypothetical protein D9613_006399 [Agrocybe pediades]|uniref:Uncharacterized protein n=1 Tax=Agrocybe pediades TaxID=84607 RepID=A0A8H4QW00_9AGAR|nr:hypothetical protein D9613_006399 [Agrocybe pediades]